MVFHWEVCDSYIKPKNKYKHCKSKSHKEFDKCEHIIMSVKEIDINDLDEALYSYNIENNKSSIFVL